MFGEHRIRARRKIARSNSQNPHMDASSITVPQGSACVEPYAQAMVLTNAHTKKNGTESRNDAASASK